MLMHVLSHACRNMLYVHACVVCTDLLVVIYKLMGLSFRGYLGQYLTLSPRGGGSIFLNHPVDVRVLLGKPSN